MENFIYKLQPVLQDLLSLALFSSGFRPHQVISASHNIGANTLLSDKTV